MGPVARVVVIGAGIAGLSAALAVSREAPPGTRVVLVDGASQGGREAAGLAGRRAAGGRGRRVVPAPGRRRASSSPGRSASAATLVHPVTTEAAVAIDGVRHRLPARTVLGVPGDRGALRRSGLLTEAGLAAVGADKAEPAPLGDPAVGQYVGRRLGREIVDRLVDPLLGGVLRGPRRRPLAAGDDAGAGGARWTGRAAS